jgi:predicted ATP-grasp superfamily ATP-dependent carboligase
VTLLDLHRRPELTDPLLVVHLEGWVDAGLGGAGAVGALLSAVETEVIATYDTDILLDHRAHRPVLQIADGVNNGLVWPELTIRAGRDAAGQSLLILAGPEPDHQWRAFCEETVALVEDLGVRMAVGLGAFPAPAPHTRPCRLVATASNAELAAAVGFVPGTINVPAGAQAALERRLADADIPAVGLWARVPHYAAAMAYPDAAAALLDGLARLTGVQVDTAELHRAAAETRAHLDALVANNPEHLRMVRQLEAQADAEGPLPGAWRPDLPSGEEIAAELERFLREQGGA